MHQRIVKETENFAREYWIALDVVVNTVLRLLSVSINIKYSTEKMEIINNL